jgi:hypothetical protein
MLSSPFNHIAGVQDHLRDRYTFGHITCVVGIDHLISQLGTLCLHDASTCPAHKRSAVLQVKFSTKSFGRDAAHVAATAIENIAATLEHADISDIIAGRPVSTAASQECA